MDIFGMMLQDPELYQNMIAAPQPPVASTTTTQPAPTVPAGTGGTPFLNYGVPSTSSPGEPGFVDPTGFYPGTAPTPTPTPAPAAPQPAAPTGIRVSPISTANAGRYGLENFMTPDGNWDFSSIPQIDLEAPPEISSMFDQGIVDNFTGLMDLKAKDIQNIYGYQLPNAQAAQMQPGSIPQPNANQIQSSPELERMLAGEGFSPAALAQMRSRAIDDTAGAGRLEMGAAKRALEQSGVGDSPAGAAIAADVARRTGGAQTAALRDIDIQNAQEGLTNFRTGVGHQQSNLASNMAAANSMALENANRMFAGMSQNLQNVQTANNAQFGAEAQKLGQQAQATGGFVANQTNMLQQAKLGKAASAEETNAANRINFGLNQAQLDRQRQMANQGALESRWKTSASLLGGFAPSADYNVSGGGFNPLGAALSDFGRAGLNQALNPAPKVQTTN